MLNCNRLLLPFVFVTLLFTAGPSPVYATDWGGIVSGMGGVLEQLGHQQKQREIEAQQREAEARQRAYERQIADQERARVEEERRNAISTGSGFFIDLNGHLITTSSVLKDRPYLAVRTVGGTFYRATMIAQDKQSNLALLKIDSSSPSLRIIHSGQAEKGQHVFAVGYPRIAIHGNESSVTDGIINSFSDIYNDPSWFQVSVPLQEGNSGGPLVDDNGDVLGVVFPVSRFNYALKSNVLIDFLSSQQVVNVAKKKGKISMTSVDHATVLVIANNTPLEVVFQERPIDKKEEDSKLTQLHPNWKAIFKSDKFKKWLAGTPSLKDKSESKLAKDRARVLDSYSQNIKDQEEAARLEAVKAEQIRKEQEALKLLALRNEEMVLTFPDWLELQKNPDFIEWLAEEPESTRKMLESPDASDVITVVKVYKALPAKTLVEIGRVTSVYTNYGYLVFKVNDAGYKDVDDVVFLLDGRKVKGSAEKRIEDNISVIISSTDINGIEKESAVYVYQ